MCVCVRACVRACVCVCVPTLLIQHELKMASSACSLGLGARNACNYSE